MVEIVHHPECRTLADALWALAKTVPVKDAHWITLPDGDSYCTDDGDDFCFDCAQREVAALRAKDPVHADDEYFLDGGWSTEHDTPPMCAICGVKLKCALTAYGASYEMDYFSENPPRPGNAAHAYEIREVLIALEWAHQKRDDDVREAIAIATKLVEAMSGERPMADRTLLIIAVLLGIGLLSAFYFMPPQ